MLPGEIREIQLDGAQAWTIEKDAFVGGAERPDQCLPSPHSNQGRPKSAASGVAVGEDLRQGV